MLQTKLKQGEDASAGTFYLFVIIDFTATTCVEGIWPLQNAAIYQKCHFAVQAAVCEKKVNQSFIVACYAMKY